MTEEKPIKKMSQSELEYALDEIKIELDSIPRDATGDDWTKAHDLLDRRREIQAAINANDEIAWQEFKGAGMPRGPIRAPLPADREEQLLHWDSDHHQEPPSL